MNSDKSLSSSSIYRLALYDRYVSSLDREKTEYASSQELAEATGQTAARVRKDLTHYGSLGEPGKGYEIGKLEAMLTRIFRKEDFRNIVLVGAGNLGLALISHRGFQLQKFKIVAAFDRDIRKVGKYVAEVPIYDVQNLDAVIAETSADMAIVCIPSQSVQQVVDKLISAGIKAILNFAPAGKISVPEDVVLQNADMSVELDRLYYFLKEKVG